DSNGNDKIDANDYIRFYGYSNGDAWNVQGVYWLSVGGSDGLRMAQRSVTAASATKRNTAYEVGAYYNLNSADNPRASYETTLAGGDGDNWFQATLNTSGAASYNFTIPHQLPLNGALPTLLTLNLTPYSVGPYGNSVGHRLLVSTSGFSTTDSWAVQFLGA